MTMPVSRRDVLATAAALASGAVAGELFAAGPPKESGLSSEGLLAGRPGFQPRTVMPLPHEAIEGFLSRERLAAHHAEYVRQVERLAATERALRDATPGSGGYYELRRAQAKDGNGVLLHELYFGGLAPKPVAPPSYLVRHMTEHMGDFESWRSDFTRCALAADAWAALVYDPYDDRWHDVVMDADDVGMWIGANPLVVCDVQRHAYEKDYPERERYVAAFLDHVDWDEVARRYKAVDRM
jgi:superoxide dismutase, Fe-Mn family